MGTPLYFWIGFAIALLISAGIALQTAETSLRRLALTLGGASMVAFVSLPLLRGYYFFASADSMSHLGWVRDIATGTIDPSAVIYPGIHVLAVLIHEVANFTLPRSLMFVPVIFAGLYFVFVPLCVWAITDSALGSTIGALSAFLLLPINVIVVKLSAHPISQTILYTAFVFLLAFWFLLGSDSRTGQRIPIGGVGSLLLLSLTALVLYHPMAAVFLLLLFGTIAVVQFISRQLFKQASILAIRPFYIPTLFLAAWLVVWMVGVHPGLVDQATRILDRVIVFFQGGSTAGQVVGERQASIQDVGASLVTIFVKLFLISAVYAMLAGIVMLASVVGRFETDRSHGAAVIKLVTIGLAVVFPWALLQFIGNISNLFFRYVGIMMVFGTIFGSVALYRITRDGRSLIPDTGWTVPTPRPSTVTSVSRTSLFALFAILLLFTAAFNYPSTSIYQPSGHMTEAQFDGHEAVFGIADPAYELSSIGYGVSRYSDAIRGPTGTSTQGGRVPTPEYDHNLVGYLTNESLGDGRYLILSDRTRIRRVVAYRGLRYDRSDFDAVESNVGIDRVFDNGEVELYLHTDNRAL